MVLLNPVSKRTHHVDSKLPIKERWVNKDLHRETLSVADPGFPGDANSRVGCTNRSFCKFMAETAWKWKNFDLGRAPLGSVTAYSSQKCLWECKSIRQPKKWNTKSRTSAWWQGRCCLWQFVTHVQRIMTVGHVPLDVLVMSKKIVTIAHQLRLSQI